MTKIFGIITILIFILAGYTLSESEITRSVLESTAFDADVKHEDVSEANEADMTDQKDEEENETEAETELEEEQVEEQEEIIEKTEEVPAGETSPDAVNAVSSATKAQDNAKQSVPPSSTAGDPATEQTTESPDAVDTVSSATKTQENAKQSVPPSSTAGDPTTGQTTESSETVVWTLELLTQYNGKNGQLAYIAVDGIIYDVTGLSPWSNGTHQGYSAGQDLTNVFKSVHGTSMLKSLAVVGVLGESLDASMIANKQTSSIMDSVDFDENDDEDDDDKDEDKDNDDDGDD